MTCLVTTIKTVENWPKKLLQNWKLCWNVMKFIFKKVVFLINLTIFLKKKGIYNQIWLNWLMYNCHLHYIKILEKKDYSKGNVWNVTQHRKLKNFQVGLIGISSQKNYSCQIDMLPCSHLCVKGQNFVNLSCEIICEHCHHTFFLVQKKKVGKSIRIQH